MDIEKLEKEILKQTRNGRTKVYVLTKDLKELGIDLSTDQERVFIDECKLEMLIKRYKELSKDDQER